MNRQWDATAQAELIKTGQVSAKELVEQTIERIERLNPTINAVTRKRYEKALVEAETRDITNQPFGGVPILLKDLGQEQAGEPSTSGSRLFKDYIASQSDNYVKALEQLGFIVLGRTNTPEFGFKNISDSQLNGVVNLPDDVTRNAGGSSGGAAAAIASGMVTVASASDGGGSIRIPASFNGLIGLKTSRGRTPVGPSSFRGWQGASVQFPLTKSVRDTRAILYHLQTCQMESPFIMPTLSYDSLYKPDKRRYRIAVSSESPLNTPVTDQAKQALSKAVAFLEAEGHEVIYIDQLPLDGIEALDVYYLMNSVETGAMFDGIEQALGRKMTVDDMELMTWAIYQSGQTIPAKVFSNALAVWDRMAHTMHQFHQTYDLLLTPTVADVAPKHGAFVPNEALQEQLRHSGELSMVEQQDLIREMFMPAATCTPYTQQPNLTGQPAISLPIYRTDEGLSLGVQLIAAKGREDMLLQLAQAFEDGAMFV